MDKMLNIYLQDNLKRPQSLLYIILYIIGWSSRKALSNNVCATVGLLIVNNELSVK